MDYRSAERRWICFVIFLAVLCSGCIRRVIDDPVFIVGGGRAGVTCNQEFEAVPCSTPESAGDVGWFASLGFNRMNFAQGDWSQWSAGIPNSTDPGFEVPINQNDPFSLRSLSGDSWSTYSESKNLAFFYFIGRPPRSISNSCVAVAATRPNKLSTNEWEFPATCLSRSRGDQCAILHIDATNTFYAACAFGTSAGSNIRIQAFDNCDGAPGPVYGCARTALLDIPNVNQLSFSIAENPCTGNLALVYRKGEDMRLKFLNQDLTEINDIRVRSNQSFAVGQTNVGCSNGSIRRCGQGTTDCTFNTLPGQCLRVNARPSIDTYIHSSGGNKTCGAVLAYDSLIRGEDDNLWAKSRLDIIDISNEIDPTVISRWNSTEDKFTWNQYLSYATVTKNRGSKRPRIAWFWLTDIRGPCNVIAEGATSTDIGNSMHATGIISGPFPAVQTNTFGIGDYIRGIKGGDRDGSLLLSWGEPVPTSSSTCTTCMGRNWNLSTKITRIHWERRRKQTVQPTRPDVLLPIPVLHTVNNN